MTQTRDRKKNVVRTISTLWVALTLAWAGCLTQHDGPYSSDTATNWLHTCTRNRDCSGDAVCAQNLCTLACRPPLQNACSSLHEDARCEVQVQGAAICDLPCARDVQCRGLGDAYVCTAGHCRERASEGSQSSPDAGVSEIPELDADSGPRPPAQDAGAPADVDAAWWADAAVSDAETVDALTPVPEMTLLSDDPGCTTQVSPREQYATLQELEPLFLGKWAPCWAHPLGSMFGDQASGAEFVADGTFYGLSKVNGSFVRNGVVGTWSFVAPNRLEFGPQFSTSAPWITLSPRSMQIGIDPTFPRFVPIKP